MADKVTAALDYMRPDIEEPGSNPAARLLASHAARLLAALDAVLELHKPKPLPDARPDEYCPQCTGLIYGDEPWGEEYVSPEGCYAREVISRALLGEDALTASQQDTESGEGNG